MMHSSTAVGVIAGYSARQIPLSLCLIVVRHKAAIKTSNFLIYSIVKVNPYV